MLYPRPTPLNRRPTVPNLPNPHRGHPPAQRVRSPAKSRPLGSISLLIRIRQDGRFAPNIAVQPMVTATPKQKFMRRAESAAVGKAVILQDDIDECASLTAPASRPSADRHTSVRSSRPSVDHCPGTSGDLPRGDRPERPGGRQREIALQRLVRFRVMTGQGERRHQDHMRILDVIRSCRDRPASQLNRLIIIPQPKIGPRLTAIPIGEPGSFGFV
jgi:hypothetical protein